MDLDNQDTTTQSATLNLNAETQVEEPVSNINESPALAALEAKLLRRRKHTEPYTYRRPTYMQYIDYV